MKVAKIDYEFKRAWQEVLSISMTMYHSPESERVKLKKELEKARSKRDALREQGAKLPYQV